MAASEIRRSARSIRVLSFHAEKLHDDFVWRYTRRFAECLAGRGQKITFFVFPLRAAVEGMSIARRVRCLADLGHEIGQHTHFYAGNSIEGPHKRDDFSGKNISRCLRRDYATLCEIVDPPTSFVAGAWFVNETALDVLSRLGFRHDCSARVPRLTFRRRRPHLRWLRSPQYFRSAHGSLLQIPTTASLGQWYRRLGHVAVKEPLEYEHVYLHDYDLLRIEMRFGLGLLRYRSCRDAFHTVEELGTRIAARTRVDNSPKTQR